MPKGIYIYVDIVAFYVIFRSGKMSEPLKMSVKCDDGSIQIYGENDERKPSLKYDRWSEKRDKNVESNNIIEGNGKVATERKGARQQ